METWLPIATIFVFLIWGLRLITKGLNPSGELNNALSEKSASGHPTSFSRVAGAIGAVALAAFFAGLSVWVLFALNDEDADIVGRISSLENYFLGGAALFAPYAFNQLGMIFRPQDTRLNNDQTEK